MKIFSYGKDGGSDSIVSGYWLIEIKPLFSIALLRFGDGSREAFHSHAFNCVSWILKGRLRELHLDGSEQIHKMGLKPILTYRDTFHKVFSEGTTWVITFRGPWVKNWKEYLPATKELVTLSSGRKIEGVSTHEV